MAGSGFGNAHRPCPILPVCRRTESEIPIDGMSCASLEHHLVCWEREEKRKLWREEEQVVLNFLSFIPFSTSSSRFPWALDLIDISSAKPQSATSKFANRRSSNSSISFRSSISLSSGNILKYDAILLSMSSTRTFPSDGLGFDALAMGEGHLVLYK